MSDVNALSQLPSTVGHAAFVGQNTSIEQTRAATEVLALVQVAQTRRRIKAVCIQDMEELCGQESFAGTAFYDYKRGGKRIYDINVDTARELARCWGNIQYGITELSQDRDHHQSEMMAWAWDMQGNLRSERKVVVPHVRDSNDKGPVILTDVRDVYELLANHASRRLRECIKDVLPNWFIVDAKKAMWKTLEYGGGEPLSKRVAGAVKKFADTYGVRRSQLEAKVGSQANDWTELDVARLKVSYGLLSQGARVEDEFPPERVETSDLEKVTVAPAPVIQPPTPTPTAEPVPAPDPVPEQPAADTPPAPEGVDMATKGHAANINNLLKRFDYPTGPEGQRRKMGDVSTLAGRTVNRTAQLTAHEANEVITQLGMALETDNPNNALDAVLDAYRTEQKPDNQ